MGHDTSIESTERRTLLETIIQEVMQDCLPDIPVADLTVMARTIYIRSYELWTSSKSPTEYAGLSNSDFAKTRKRRTTAADAESGRGT